MMLPRQPYSKVRKAYWFVDRKHHLSSSPGLAAKWIAVQKTVLVVNAQQKSEGAGEGGGGGVIMLKKVCGGGGRQIKNEKKRKTREAPVLCYGSFSAVTSLHFPWGWRGRWADEVGGRGEREKGKVEPSWEVAVALRRYFCGHLSLLGIPQQRVLTPHTRNIVSFEPHTVQSFFFPHWLFCLTTKWLQMLLSIYLIGNIFTSLTYCTWIE